jgi:hypothetical protein
MDSGICISALAVVTGGGRYWERRGSTTFSSYSHCGNDVGVRDERLKSDIKTRTLQKPKSAAPAKDKPSLQWRGRVGHPPDNVI